MTANPRAHAELLALLGRKRLQLGGRKGQHRENSRNSAKRVKKTRHEEKLEFPWPAESVEHQAERGQAAA